MPHILKNDLSSQEAVSVQEPSEDSSITKHHLHLIHAVNVLKYFIKELYVSSKSAHTEDTADHESVVQEFAHLFGLEGELRILFLDIKAHKGKEVIKDLRSIEDTFLGLREDFKQILGSILDVDQSGQLIGLVPHLLSLVTDLAKGDLKHSLSDLTQMKTDLNQMLTTLLGDLIAPSKEAHKIVNNVENMIGHLTMIGEDIYVIVEDAQMPINTQMIMKDVYDLTGNINGILEDVNSCLNMPNQKLQDVTLIVKHLHQVAYQLYTNPNASGEIKEEIDEIKKELHDLFQKTPKN